MFIVGNSNGLKYEDQGCIVTTEKGIFITPRYISEIAMVVWEEYAEVFKGLWSLRPHESMFIGYAGGKLQNVEFQEFGDKVYTDSPTTAIRNALYACSRLDDRWQKLKEGKRLKEPLLDFGCGVGVFARFLQWKGYNDIYGYDLNGIQTRIMKEVGVPLWDRKMPCRFETVLCTNVLEHLPNPVETLDYLRTLSDNVIANCDTNEEPEHIAPMKVREAINKSLRERGEHFEA